MTSPTTIVWFRDDLRLTDNAALTWAAKRGPVVGLYIHESVGRPIGAAASWWLRQSLGRLRDCLAAPLLELTGDPREIVPRIAAELNARVTWNRRYHLVDVDAEIKSKIDAVSHPGFLLTEPWEVHTTTGGPYRVFTPFFNAVQKILLNHPPQPLPRPAITAADVEPVTACASPEPDWTATLAQHNNPGEAGALDRFHDFVEGRSYDNDQLAPGSTSNLSAHLRFGEISPATVWSETSASSEINSDLAAFLRQLVWRDFAWHRFYHHPDLTTVNVRRQFDHFPWEWTSRAVPGSDAAAFAHHNMDPQAQHLEQLAAWQAGRTGVPLVDAGMRQLWATGQMHNRVRMVAASWLTKNLGIHWRHGEEWFWDTLVDADAASNPFNWQWVAGSGDDAAPYFRIFNPLTQQKKFDSDGAYVRTWLPEAATCDYPEPMVDVGLSRKTALAAYDDVKAHA